MKVLTCDAFSKFVSQEPSSLIDASFSHFKFDRITHYAVHDNDKGYVTSGTVFSSTCLTTMF